MIVFIGKCPALANGEAGGLIPASPTKQSRRALRDAYVFRSRQPVLLFAPMRDIAAMAISVNQSCKQTRFRVDRNPAIPPGSARACAFILRAHPQQTHEMLFDAHNHAFRVLGGVLWRGILRQYANRRRQGSGYGSTDNGGGSSDFSIRRRAVFRVP